MARPTEFYYTYEDIQKLTGLSMNMLYQYRRRKDLDPERLESVVLFCARHGSLKFRRRMLDYMLSQRIIEKPGDRRRKRR